MGKDHSSHYLHGPGQLEDLGRVHVEAGIRLFLTPFSPLSWAVGIEKLEKRDTADPLW